MPSNTKSTALLRSGWTDQVTRGLCVTAVLRRTAHRLNPARVSHPRSARRFGDWSWTPTPRGRDSSLLQHCLPSRCGIRGTPWSSLIQALLGNVGNLSFRCKGNPSREQTFREGMYRGGAHRGGGPRLSEEADESRWSEGGPSRIQPRFRRGLRGRRLG